MNASRIDRRRAAYARRYPNAADRSYYLNKLADTLLCLAGCVGLVTVLFFFITM